MSVSQFAYVVYIYCKIFKLRDIIIFSLEAQHKHCTSVFVFRELRNTEYENATLAQIEVLQFHEPCGQNAIHVVKVSQSN
jgi:hypothetical protein